MPVTNEPNALTARPVSASGSAISAMTIPVPSPTMTRPDEEREAQGQKFDDRPVPHWSPDCPPGRLVDLDRDQDGAHRGDDVGNGVE